MAYTEIDDPGEYFNTVLYTGTGSSNAISGVGFSPNWVWIKERDSTSSHSVSDTIRGVTKRLNPDLTAAEETLSGLMTSFDSDGFTNAADNGVNENTKTYVAWNWKAETSFTNDASGTSIGTIDSAGSVNQDAGFSIVSYTNTNQSANSGVATIKHGLNTTPNVMILKDRDATSDWSVYHSSLPTNKYLSLNKTDAGAVDANMWNNTAPTSTVFTVGDNSYSNPANRKMIGYIFAEKKGFSKFGSYTGNNNANGPFVYTGFKPAWLMIKISSGTTNNWMLYDNKRSAFNLTDDILEANNSGAEGEGLGINMLSNGFKIKTTAGNGTNYNGGTYIYMAFAEQPFVTSTGVPATAK